MGPWTARVPPGTGGGEGMAEGRTGNGLLIHSLTDAAGLPWSTRTPPAPGDERAQVLPWLDTRHIRTGTRGRPRQRVKGRAADHGDDAKALRQRRRRRGSRPQIPQRVWQSRQPRGRPSKTAVPRCQAERTFAWCQRKYRPLVVRWERLAAGFAAFLAIATIQIWLQRFIAG